ncbi:MAG: PhzF family phenazine biosynthesis isomerase, partial [Bacteroidota bacterium]
MTLTTVDAFASRPFTGNPAAVCILDAPAPEAWMQALAGEMNLSETAFLVPKADGAFGLRWFTPEVEVDLCGHATLASAHVLFTTGRLGAGAEARFDT